MTRPHRALILQGGGALGAYEAGAVCALAEKLAEEDKENKNPHNKPLFDIIAGSSIGAVNAVILVNSVVNALRGKHAEHMTGAWKNAVHNLANFWTEVLPTHTLVDNASVRSLMTLWIGWADYFTKTTRQYWNSVAQSYLQDIERIRSSPANLWYYFAWPDKWPDIASAEALRRYLEYQHSIGLGTQNVLSGAIPQGAEIKFLNPFPLYWRFDNSPLLSLIQSKYWPQGIPIRTNEGEPRLLLVAVDVQNCSTAVTFDSYPKAGGGLYTEYGGDKEKHVIAYDGVTPTQLLASMSTHLRHEYPQMTTKDGRPRVFWDGAYLSNTPLREALHSHRDYWKAKPDGIVPDLEVYIVNLYPAIEDSVPNEPDSIQDREVDIKFHDRTKYDLKVAEMTGDYANLTRELLKIIGENPDSRAKAEVLLRTSIAKSKKRNGDKRTYADLLKGRFRVVRSVYVERMDDKDAIYGKAFDFSYSSLKGLFDQGLRDGSHAYDEIAAKEK